MLRDVESADVLLVSSIPSTQGREEFLVGCKISIMSIPTFFHSLNLDILYFLCIHCHPTDFSYVITARSVIVEGHAFTTTTTTATAATTT